MRPPAPPSCTPPGLTPSSTGRLQPAPVPRGLDTELLVGSPAAAADPAAGLVLCCSNSCSCCLGCCHCCSRDPVDASAACCSGEDAEHLCVVRLLTSQTCCWLPSVLGGCCGSCCSPAAPAAPRHDSPSCRTAAECTTPLVRPSAEEVQATAAQRPCSAPAVAAWPSAAAAAARRLLPSAQHVGISSACTLLSAAGCCCGRSSDGAGAKKAFIERCPRAFPVSSGLRLAPTIARSAAMPLSGTAFEMNS